MQQQHSRPSVITRNIRRSACELPLRAPRGAPPETDSRATQRSAAAAVEAKPSGQPAPVREDGLRAALQACECELQTERAGAAERANLLRAELVRAERREGQLLEELEHLRRKMLRERSRRRAAERDLERCRMEAEDTRRSDLPAGSRLLRLSPSPSTPDSSRSMASLSDATAGVLGPCRTSSDLSAKGVRRNAFGLPLSPGTPPPKAASAARTSPLRSPSPDVLSEAESLVLEMFSGCEAPTTRSVQARSPPAASRSPLKKAYTSPAAGTRSLASKEPWASPSNSARSEASAQTEPPGFPSYGTGLAHSPSPSVEAGEAKKPMLSALNGCMPTFPSAELGSGRSKSNKSLAPRRKSCPVFEQSASSAAAAAWGSGGWLEGGAAAAASAGGMDEPSFWLQRQGSAATTVHEEDDEVLGGRGLVAEVAIGAEEGGQVEDHSHLAGIAIAVAAAMGSSDPWLSPKLSPDVRGEESAPGSGASPPWGPPATIARGGGRPAEPAAGGRAEVSPLMVVAEGLAETPGAVGAGLLGMRERGDLGRLGSHADAAWDS